MKVVVTQGIAVPLVPRTISQKRVSSKSAPSTLRISHSQVWGRRISRTTCSCSTSSWRLARRAHGISPTTRRTALKTGSMVRMPMIARIPASETAIPEIPAA